ncbi:MAG: SDR family oxidoreductase [Rhodobacteraceae bacterium]|nr:MAG: SDR family oxidoreductase [Paracoccaceae bacterium]
MSFTIDLGGKRAFLTGGSRGLGREMALALARAGADIALVARPSEALQETAREIRALGRTVWTHEADVSLPEAAEAVCTRALEAAGHFDIVVNNVGGRRVNVPTEDLDLKTWQEMLDLNLTSTFICSRTLGAAMIAAGKGGRIINVASINGLVAGRGIGGRHYEAAKAGVIQFTRTLAVDWARHGITANAICPGIFATAPNLGWQRSHPEIIDRLIADIPMGQMGDPRDLGALAVYLASDAARFMTGASLVIDGGQTCH